MAHLTPLSEEWCQRKPVRHESGLRGACVAALLEVCSTAQFQRATDRPGIQVLPGVLTNDDIFTLAFTYINAHLLTY